MKITLTAEQVRLVLNAVEWAYNPDFPPSDSLNLKLTRIENKLKSALLNAEKGKER